MEIDFVGRGRSLVLKRLRRAEGKGEDSRMGMIYRHTIEGERLSWKVNKIEKEKMILR